MEQNISAACEAYINLLSQLSKANEKSQLGQVGEQSNNQSTNIKEVFVLENASAYLEYWQIIDSSQIRCKNLSTSEEPIHTSTFINSRKSLNLIIARRQIKGRGRYGRSFFSPLGGLYYSFVLPESSQLKLALYTPLLAVAVRQSLEAVTKLSCQIKWVNDLYLQRKKVAGIICERVHRQGQAAFVVCGIGINWTDANAFTASSDASAFTKNADMSAFNKSSEANTVLSTLPPELINKVGNLQLKDQAALQERAYLSILQTEFLQTFFAELACLSTAQINGINDFMTTYEDNLYLKNQQVTLSNGLTCQIITIDHQDGALIVETKSKKHLKINSGEISLLIDTDSDVN